MILATAQFTISIIKDGLGIQTTIIDYAVSLSGVTPPGNIITDGEGNPIMSNDGKPLTDGDWTTTLPTVPQGMYLWTRTRLVLTNGSFDMIYNVSRAGEDGPQGEDAPTPTHIYLEFRLSDSSTTITGSGTGYSWSTTQPEIESGQYLWKREVTEYSDGSTLYSNAYCELTMSGVLFNVDKNSKAISGKVWQSDITNYDNSVGKSIRDRVTKTEQDISTINSTVSDVQSTLTQKADGTTVTNLERRISTAETTADGFRQTVEHNYAKLTDVGANNLYVIKNEVPGYIHSSNGTISNPSASKEVTSAYIPVDVGSTYIIQSWATPTVAGKSWLAYQYYSDNQGTIVGTRVSKYGDTTDSGVEVDSNGLEHLTYQITIPEGVTHIRVSYSHFDDGYAMVEKATTPSAYIMNPLDSQGYTDSAKSEIMQTANKITWLVQSGDSASNFTLTNRVAELISPQVVIKDPAGNSTIITGGKIQANAITTAMLATDVIKSTGYTPSANVDSPYSSIGTFLDLSNGNFWTPNFGVIQKTPDGTQVPTGAWFNGTVYANAGRFGEGSSYWNIENFTDNNLNEYAGLVATGYHAYIQAGHWQVNDDAVQTKKYITTSEGAGQVSYYYDSDTTNRYYDVGMKIPIDFTERSTNDDKEAIYKKAFFYERKSVGNFIPPSDADGDWDYLFFVDHQGNIYSSGDIYVKGKKLSELYAPISGDADSHYVMTKGSNTIDGSLTVTTLTVTGTLTATASQANKLTNKLSINGVYFDGETDVTVGTIGVAYGGTGETSWTANRIVYASDTNTLNQLGAGTSGQLLRSNGSSAPGWVDQSSIAAGSATNATNATNDANGDKIDTTYRKLSDTAFPNGLTGNVTGNVSGTAGSVKNNLIIKLNGGTTEGTDLFTYNGSAKKTINITGALLGLSEASTHGVDTSISSGSTSSNLPTSEAVADFVENLCVLGVAESNDNGKISVTTASGTSSVAVHGLGSWAYKSSGSASDVGLGNVTNNKQVKGLASGTTTSGHLVVWDSDDGCTVADSGLSKSGIVSGISISNDELTVKTADGNSSSYTINITGQVVSGATVLSDSNGNSISLGSASAPVYFSNGVPAQANTIPTITLNGSATTSASFYAPTGVGNNKQYLMSKGSGAPEWATFSKSTVGLENVDNTADNIKNVLSATKFSDARSITLTGDTTGTASSDGTNGWSIPTTTKQLTTLGRLTSADIQTNTTQSKKVTFAYSSSAMTTSKPTGGHGYILTFAWDNGGYASQFFLKHTKTPHAMIRGAGSATINGVENSSDWGDWIYLLDANNYNDYSPTLEGAGATGTWDISVSGVAATATNAINDSDSNPINTTYAKLSGATFTGAVTGTSFSASSYIAANSGNSGVAGGIALYGTTPTTYGIAMRQTSNGGKHGHVQGDWAIYSYMNGADNRGWILKNNTNNATVASVDNTGNAAFNGEVSIGTSGTNIDGSCSLVMNRDLGCLDFVFN